MVSQDDALTDFENCGERTSPGLPTRRQVFGFLLAYFAVQILTRVLISSSTDLDESEQLMLTQKFSWGYGSQPPLYTWIQMAFFSVFGVTVFSLSLFKNLLLFCTYGLTYANAKFITRSHPCAVAASASLLFIPQVAWESQRDLTHSVFSATLAAATLHCFLRLCRNRSAAWYLGFGLCAGAGLLSKYNYVFWLLGLLLAGISIREIRPVVSNWRMLAAGMIGLAILAPNGLWILNHRELAFTASHKLGLIESGGWLGAVGTGLWHLLVAAVSFLGPLALMYLLIFFKANGGSAKPRSVEPVEKLLSRTVITIGILLLLLVLVFRVTNIRERWLQPILICAPVLAVVLVRDRLDEKRSRWVVGSGLLVMCVVAVFLPARVLLSERIRREERLTRPYDALAAQMRPILPEGSLVVTDLQLLGGNLRVNLPGRWFATSDLAGLFQAGNEPCFLAWDASKSEEPPKLLLDWAKKSTAAEQYRSRPQYFTATYKYHQSKQLRLGLLQIK